VAPVFSVFLKDVNINEMSLKERLEAADREFSGIYFRKMRLARAGIQFYPAEDLYADLLTVAGNWGLFALALWSYHRALHGPD
jgi:hypothetical protein